MRTLVTSTLRLAIVALVLAGQVGMAGTLERIIPTTSEFSRRALTNETMAQWDDMLGLNLTNLTNVTITVEVQPGPGITVTTTNGVVTVGLYVAPTITSFTNNKTVVEIGTTVSSTVMGWTLGSGAITNQLIYNGITLLATPGLADRTYTDTGSYVSDRTYTLSCSDASTTVTLTSAVLFEHKRYWGASASATLTSPQIIALSGEFATTPAKAAFTVALSAEYFYYAFPSAWGVAKFYDPFENTAYAFQGAQLVTNAANNVTSYDVYRSSTPLTGSPTITVTQ